MLDLAVAVSIVSSHLFEHHVAVLDLVRAFEDLLKEALSHVLADEHHVVHQVLQDLELVLLTVC